MLRPTSSKGSPIASNLTVNTTKSGSTDNGSKQPKEEKKHETVVAKSHIEDDPTLKVGATFFRNKRRQLQIQKRLEENVDLSLCIAVVGAPGVGKNALTDAECPQTQITTSTTLSASQSSSIQIKTKVYLIGDKKIHVQYYVVPGNQFYQSLSSRLVSGFPVTLFVFDVNEAETLDAVQDWMEDVRPRNARPRLWTPMNFLIGNKTDTPGTRIILSSEGQKAAEELEMKYYETSALEPQKVNEVFSFVMNSVLEAATAVSKPLSPAKPAKHRNSFSPMDGIFGVKSEKRQESPVKDRRVSLAATDVPRVSQDLGTRKSALGSFDMGSVGDSMEMSTWLDIPRAPATDNTSQVSEVKYPHQLQVGLQLSRKGRLVHRMDFREDLPGVQETTTFFDWY